MESTNEVQLEAYSLEAEIAQDEYFTWYRAVRKADNAPVVIKRVSPLYAADEFWLFQSFRGTAQRGLANPRIWW